MTTLKVTTSVASTSSGMSWVVGSTLPLVLSALPIGGRVGKILRIGALPLDVQLGAYYNVVRPDNGPEWELRAQVQLIFPR